MADRCTITVDGCPLEAIPGESLAVALVRTGHLQFRQSRLGQPRAPLCGMGTCHECLVRVNGAWLRACLEPVREGLQVLTHD
jgi:sarcosine oxidase subunit alpha